MAKEDTSASASGGKRRWYHNLKDSYTVVKRSYKWAPLALVAMPVLVLVGAVAYALYSGSWIFSLITAVMLSITLDMGLLTTLLRPAMYKQIDGKMGAAYAVISQIKKGWAWEEEPVAVNRQQDIVWQLVGRPGVVLVSEGPSSRVRQMLVNEKKRVRRVVRNVPITFIEVGNGEGQVPLAKLNRKLRSLPKTLTKQEVPAVANRLTAVGSKGVAIPKGVDPYNTRANRKAMWQ